MANNFRGRETATGWKVVKRFRWRMIPAGLFVLLGSLLLFFSTFILMACVIRQPFGKPYPPFPGLIRYPAYFAAGVLMTVFGRSWWRRTSWRAVLGCIVGYFIAAFANVEAQKMEKRPSVDDDDDEVIVMAGSRCQLTCGVQEGWPVS